jgi:hypothetical protein
MCECIPDFPYYVEILLRLLTKDFLIMRNGYELVKGNVSEHDFRCGPFILKRGVRTKPLDNRPFERRLDRRWPQ